MRPAPLQAKKPATPRFFVHRAAADTRTDRRRSPLPRATRRQAARRNAQALAQHSRRPRMNAARLRNKLARNQESPAEVGEARS